MVRTTKEELVTREELLPKIAKAAGQALLSVVADSGIVTKEGRGNFVTAGDKQSEQILISAITTSFPTDTILSEETASGLTPAALMHADHLWIIDPIDGTANFRYQRNYSSVSIGYAEQGELKL